MQSFSATASLQTAALSVKDRIDRSDIVWCLVPMFQACVLTLYGDRSPSSGPTQACRMSLHTGNTTGKSSRPSRLRHCAANSLSGQSAAFACLAVKSGSFGGWDDEPAATFDSAGAIVAIGHSRDRGCRLARCPRAYRNPEHRRGVTQRRQRSLSLPNKSSPRHRSQARCSTMISVKPM